MTETWSNPWSVLECCGGYFGSIRGGILTDSLHNRLSGKPDAPYFDALSRLPLNSLAEVQTRLKAARAMLGGLANGT